MGFRINTNIEALNAQRNLSLTAATFAKSVERLSSGLRINRAGDDAAGLSISEKLRAQVRGLNQAIRNAQDGISMIQTAEGALNEVHSMLQRMRELATQAANDTLSAEDRAAINRELQQLKEEKFVLFSEGYSLRPIVWQACLQAGFEPKIAFEGGETDTIRGLVAAGMGVSLLPEMALFQTNPLQPAQVRVVEPTITRTVGLIHRSDEKLPLVAHSFRTFLLSYFRLRENNTPVGT